jgi:hypothetical protein
MSLVQECEIMKIHGTEHKTIKKAQILREYTEQGNFVITFEIIFGL